MEIAQGLGKEWGKRENLEEKLRFAFYLLSMGAPSIFEEINGSLFLLHSSFEEQLEQWQILSKTVQFLALLSTSFQYYSVRIKVRGGKTPTLIVFLRILWHALQRKEQLHQK